MFDCPVIDSALGHDSDLIPVSLELVWPKGMQCEQNLSEKWPVAKLAKKKATTPMLFYVIDFVMI